MRGHRLPWTLTRAAARGKVSSLTNRRTGAGTPANPPHSPSTRHSRTKVLRAGTPAYYLPDGGMRALAARDAHDRPPPSEAHGEPQELHARVQQLERQLTRVRRSRKVLIELLWRLDREWRQRVQLLEEDNRRLWAARQRRDQA